MAQEQLVLFSIGNEEYAVPIAKVKEIIQYKDATKLPNAPKYMKGVISLRGKIIPVIDLAVRLALTPSEIADKRALIIETSGREIGILVDEVTEVILLPDSAIESLSMVTANRYIRGIGKAEGNRLLILLDVDWLFSEDEMQELKKVG